jgi:Mg-chelatase subunit ChlD
MRRRPSYLASLLPAAIGPLALVFACAPTAEDTGRRVNGSAAAPSGTGRSNSAGGTASSGGSTVIIPTSGSSGSGGSPPTAVCKAESRDGQRVPVDMYFLVDSSGSMGEDVPGGLKWDLVSGALIDFLSDPRSAELGLGIGYFPVVTQGACAPGQPNCVCIPFTPICFSLAGGSCSVTDYATPSVPLALPSLPSNLVANIGAHALGGGTPTRPAVEGALGYLSRWADEHPGRKPLLVLATDGEPTECDRNTPDDVAELAAAALAGPHAIQTFVIGVGASLTSLNAIAQAGGTDRAFLVDTGGDVAMAFADALDAIRGVAAPCEFVIPTQGSDGGSIDPGKVNVRYTSNGASGSILLPQVAESDPANCGDPPGWYYDNPAAPTTIKLCPAACMALGQGTIEVEFGCDTIVQPPR